MSKVAVVLKSIVMACVLSFVLINAVSAAEKSNIKLEQFWVVLPPVVAKSTAGYGIIKNTGNKAVRLVGIRSNAATIMLHRTEISSGMVQMTHLPSVLIEPNSELVLEPMSFHLMLSNIADKVFKGAAEITLILEFDKADAIEIEVPVRPRW